MEKYPHVSIKKKKKGETPATSVVVTKIIQNVRVITKVLLCTKGCFLLLDYRKTMYSPTQLTWQALCRLLRLLKRRFTLLGRSGGSHNKQKITILNYK